MPVSTRIKPRFQWENIDNSDGYDDWRSGKLKAAEDARDAAPIALSDFANPAKSELDAIRARLDQANFTLYTTPESDRDPESVRATLRGFADAFGLRIAEAHRSAGDLGVVALRPSDAPAQRGYIPYSTRSMNWHTDGYYNAPQDLISAFVLHCVRPATTGGVNQLLDPEVLYIRLRDADPAFVRALMHPQAMSIPENREPDGTLRPVSVGPVFYPDPESGRLQMRYTARTRSIAWRDDPATRAAAAFIRSHLEQGDPLARDVRMQAGQGLLSNNILHNRTGFDKPSQDNSGRLIYRVRFHNRVERNQPWQNSAT